MKQIVSKINAFLGSRRCFWIIVGFFVFEALWFVFSALYPMAFDEEIHMGIIKIYAGQWSPFLGAQPPSADYLGALSSDPSYLFHYLMSFPYRLITALTDNQAVLVILLRLMNVAMFVGALSVFRKVLLRAKTSPALTNVILAVIALIPTAPMLAAHINYDNLLTLLVAFICWLVLEVMAGLRRKELPLKQLAVLAAVCMATALVKYAALPIVAAVFFFLVVYAWRCFKGHGRQFGPALKKGLAVLSRPARIGLIAALLAGSVLFGQRYGVNLYRYHTPVPECDMVLSEARCEAFSPWKRNHRMATQKGNFDHNLYRYIKLWQHDMRRRLLFAVNGPHHGYRSRPPLPVLFDTAGYLTLVSLVLFVVFWRRVFTGRPALTFFAVVILLYTVVLLLNGYADYLYTGVAVAINGRYFLPIIALMGAVLGQAFSVALARWPGLKLSLATIVLVLFLQGGGVMTFIVRSDPGWYWPNQGVQQVNHWARNILKPLIIEGSK